MASGPSTSALGRGRTGRLAVNSARHQPPAAPPPSRGLVVPSAGPLSSGTGLFAPGPPSQVLGNVVQASNLELFLANLRILDLDLLEDWPQISAQTFGSSAAGLKRRVQAVEWALYHLFSLWDPQETHSKLEPFFPPVDQVQSLNLRAALLRSLEQVKKNGFLGRDAVIRKTMLDECRGDRLEEVLATFSFAVVRRVVSERTEAAGAHPALAQVLALENRGYAGERTELAVLKLAHQAALWRALREKDEARAVYGDFSDLLDVKERSIVRRREQVKAVRARGDAAGVTEDDKLDVWRVVRNNWAGSERWMETLLYGDSNARRDGLLSTPFDKVWRRVQAGRLSELDDRGSGLMEQLDSRVRLQQERVRKWESFRKSMLGDSPAANEVAVADESLRKRKGLGLTFTDHQKIRPDQMSPREGRAEEKAAENINLSPACAELIASFDRDLKLATQPRATTISALLPKLPPQRSERLSIEPLSTSTDIVSEYEDVEEDVPPIETAPPIVVTKLPQRKSAHRPSHSRKLLHGDLPRPDARAKVPELRRPRTLNPAREAPAVPPAVIRVSPPRSPTRTTRSSPHDELPTPKMTHVEPEPSVKFRSSRDDQEPSISEELLKSPTQQQADDILASISNASPSPVKPRPRQTLTLAERTRLSMARTPHANLSDDDDEGTLPSHLNPAPAPAPILEVDGDAGHDDLVARTRKSMAGFEAARQKAQLERRRSVRRSRREGSHFPRPHEGQFGRVGEEDHDASAIAEELMEGEHNYDDVFMSRPKIMASPIPWPTGEYEDDE